MRSGAGSEVSADERETHALAQQLIPNHKKTDCSPPTSLHHSHPTVTPLSWNGWRRRRKRQTMYKWASS